MYVVQEMKTLAILILLASSAQSQKFEHDNQTGDWLPIPDDFVWPKAAEKPPDFNPIRKKFSELAENQRTAINTNWPDEKPPETVEIATIDLNGDGNLEIFVGVPDYSGTGGTFYEILSTKDGKSFRSIGGIQGWGFQFLVAKSGWLQIEGMSRGGGGNYTRYLVTFNKDAYEISRNEGHDYNNHKVTIRKKEAQQDAPSNR